MSDNILLQNKSSISERNDTRQSTVNEEYILCHYFEVSLISVTIEYIMASSQNPQYHVCLRGV